MPAPDNKTKEGDGEARKKKKNREGGKKTVVNHKEMFRVWLPSERRVIILILAQTR